MMEYTTETVEIEEICEDGVPMKKFKQIDYPRFIDLNDANIKNWVEKPKKDGLSTTATVTTYQLEAGGTECIELATNETNDRIEVKTLKKTSTSHTITPVRNRPGKRQIRVIDPNLPAFVCTEHNENISLDCRYCRIASGFKKKSTQRIVQNDEISSTGKVTVAIPRKNPDIIPTKHVDEILESNRDAYCSNSSRDTPNNAANKIVSTGKYVQRFRSEWLNLPEFKDWLIECKLSGDGDMSQAQCKFCGTLLVNNSNNLVRHAISKKHMKNMEIEKSDLNTALGEQSLTIRTDTFQTPHYNQKSNTLGKEEIFGAYIASELKRIKNKKTYEDVKWKILQTLQSAAEKEAEEQEKSTSE